MKKAEQRKQTMIDNLLAKIRDLKMKVDELYQQECDLSQGMKQSEVQYKAFLNKLKEQRRRLERQISDSRQQLQYLQQGSRPNGPPRKRQPKPTHTDKQTSLPSMPLPAMKNKQLEQKKRISKFFSKYWHPDKQWSEVDPNRKLMIKLQQVSEESKDAVDMLIALPWHKAWEERPNSEKISDQWERLVEWQVCLEEALERLPMRLDKLKQDLRYPFYIEWEVAESKHDYFSGLASHERAEIERLKQTLDTVQQKLNEAKQTGEH